jgi:hypothetical protein
MRCLLLFLSVLVLFFNACNASLHYRPGNWKKVDNEQWSRSFGLITLTTKGMDSMSGSKNLSTAITINNKSGANAVVDNAFIRSKGSEYPSPPVTGDSTKQITIAPGEKREIVFQWEFKQSVGETLAEPVELEIKVMVGKDHTEVIIPMVEDMG